MSAALCQRSSGSLARHVRTIRSSAAGDSRLGGGDRRGVFLHDRGDEGSLAGSGKGLFPRRHLVEHRAEGEDVGARVGFPAFELLGRHVLESPQDGAFLGQPLLGGERGQAARRIRRGHRFGETEVEELDARPGQHDVGGLQVAMHDAAPVRLVQCVRDLDADPKRLFERESALCETSREGVAFEKLHDEVLGLAVTPDVVERADVRVRELRDGLRLSLQPLARLGRGGQPRRQDLDRDLAAQAGVLCAVDLAHSARAERREDLVGAQARSGGESHVTPPLPSPRCRRPAGETGRRAPTSRPATKRDSRCARPGRRTRTLSRADRRRAARRRARGGRRRP